MSEVGVVRRRRSRAEIEALVAEFESSGLMRASDRSAPGIRCGNVGAPAERIGTGVGGVRVWTGDTDLCRSRRDGHAKELQRALWSGTRSSGLRSGKRPCV
jgi:hypothetical protein